MKVRNTITDFPDATKFDIWGTVTNITRDVASFMFRTEENFYTKDRGSRFL